MRSIGDSSPENQLPELGQQGSSPDSTRDPSMSMEDGEDRPDPIDLNNNTDLEEADSNPTSAAESTAAAPQATKGNLKPILVEIVQTILLTLIIFAAVRSVVQNFKIDGASMEPTLHSGQYLLINKIVYLRLEGFPLDLARRVGLAPQNGSSYYPFGGPQRGDITVFRYPGYPDRDFIKRVIAVPGDTVQVDQGRVTVNGVLLHEDYIRALPSYSLPKQKVPEGRYFVLGDNRPNSSDSHIWGFVPEENLIGKAWLSYWPPGSWGPVPNTGLAGN